MRYLGGKSRIAKQLAARIRELVPDAAGYWDPFCGGLSMSVALSEHAPVLASDACAPLIALYQAVRNGWVPPNEVSRETWQAAKSLSDTDPMKAFCGFGCSFGGNGRGYVEGKRRDGAPTARRSLLRDVPRVSAFACVNWLDVEPRSLGGAVLYLDPPYAGREGYSWVGPFDHGAFTDSAREWSRFAHVFVSEFDFSLGELAWQGDVPVSIGNSHGVGGRATERLYYIPKGSTWA